MNPIISKAQYIQKVIRDLDSGIRHNKKSIEKLAASFGITDKTQVKEFTELAIVLKARVLAHLNENISDRYFRIVQLYKDQVTLSHRTSQSILLQQYSTPAPIAFLAGIFAGIDQNISVFEPSAGNGLLTIAANPKNVIVNEIDLLRRSNLTDQGYKQILNQDATQPFKGFEKKFDAVLTNPPFGILSKEVKYETFGIKTLDHLMALRALDCMKDNGKASIIIGGHTRYDKKGRIQEGRHRIFFNYIYSRYKVVDMINIDGSKLYSRQGTSFDVRLILIDGRKIKPAGAAAIYNVKRDKVVDTFEELFDRVMMNVKEEHMKQASNMNSIELEAKREFEVLNFNYRWSALLGKPAKNFTMMIHGEPGGGKTTLLLKFAQYLAENFGKVIFISSEEFGATTLTTKVKELFNEFPPNLHFTENVKQYDLWEYDFIILDSVNDLGLTIADFKQLKLDYPNAAFILLLQHTKSGQFKGGKEWEHETEIAGEIENGLVTIYKNRYGVKGSFDFFNN